MMLLMDFVHRPYIPGETISAIITAPGNAAIAAIRISGDKALEVADTIFSGNVLTFTSHTAHYGTICDTNNQPLDHVLLLVMKNPKSFTGEDTVEIFCHGGSIITRKIYERTLEAGARAAGPGEFSLKAVKNGKIDLSQAEAIQELICAQNELALSAAEKQLEGKLSLKIKEFQAELTEIAAILEAWVDFPEEGLEFASFEEIITRLKNISKRMQELNNTFYEGRIVSKGLSLCLIGTPNVGKSSLMNALLNSDRAIVTPTAGTTRDTLEESVLLNNLHFRLIDTAGIRSTEEEIEKEGIFRSKQAQKEADLTLLLLDASSELKKEDLQLISYVDPDKTLLVWNKIDLGTIQHNVDLPHQVHISAKQITGLQDLQNAIEKLVWRQKTPQKQELVITEQRHRQALSKAIEFTDEVLLGLQNGVSAEFVAADIRSALTELGSIIGTNVGEDILSSIFSKFCVGK